MSYAVLEGTSRIVDWGGYRAVREPDLSELLGVVSPDLVIVEDPMLSQKGPRSARGVIAAARVAQQHDIPVSAVRWMPKSRRQLADRLIANFPELQRVAPSNRAAWRVNRVNLDLFVAIGRAQYVVKIYESTDCRPGICGPLPNWSPHA